MFRVNDIVRYNSLEATVTEVTDDVYLTIEFVESGITKRRVFHRYLELIRRPFQVGDRVHYLGCHGGEVTEVRDEDVIVEIKTGPLAGETRAFTLEGKGRERGDLSSSITHIEIVPCSFTIGDEVLHSGYAGSVTAIDQQYVVVTLDDGRPYLYKRDGSGSGGSGTDYSHNARHTAALARLEKVWPFEWVPNPHLTYPPEPAVEYGVFDYYSQPIEAGYEGVTKVGYGIINSPDYCCVAITPDDATLAIPLREAKKKHLNQCLIMELEALDNPFELLVGLKLEGGFCYTDRIKFNTRLGGRPVSAHFDYSATCLAPGLLSQTELNNKLLDSTDLTITAVEDNKITLSDGTQFYLNPRYIETAKPMLCSTQTDKILLIKNLVMRRNNQDEEMAMAA